MTLKLLPFLFFFALQTHGESAARWTRLYCVGGDGMSPFNMGTWLCRDPVGRVYTIMAGGFAYNIPVASGHAAVMWVRGDEDVSGIYAGGSIGVSAIVGGQIGWYSQLGGAGPGRLIMAAASVTLPASEMALICSTQLMSPSQSLLAGVNGRLNTLHVKSGNHTRSKTPAED